MRKLLLLLLCVPAFVYAQEEKGIHFEQSSTWEQLKLKAKIENKYIFVDCFATWCKPCKAMDKQVYSLDSIGEYMNTKFVSIKVQFDTSKQDNEIVKSWYSEAVNIKKQYNILAMPTYLIFDANGIAVHKEVGARIPGDFLQMMKNAQDPEKQYYTLLTHYQNDAIKNYPNLLYLARAAVSNGETAVAETAFRDYTDNHMIQHDTSLFTKKTMSILIEAYTFLTTTNKAFQFIYHNRNKIDSALQMKEAATSMINTIITRDFITPVIEKAVQHNLSSLNWSQLEQTIARKYTAKDASAVIKSAKIGWYYQQKDWKNYCASLISLLKGQQHTDGLSLNNAAYELFKYSTDKDELTIGIQWANEAITLISEESFHPTIIDTKANLLYKLGRTSEAIQLQSSVVASAPNVSEFIQNLEKMKRGEPTWKKM